MTNATTTRIPARGLTPYAVAKLRQRIKDLEDHVKALEDCIGPDFVAQFRYRNARLEHEAAMAARDRKEQQAAREAAKAS